MTAGAPPPDSRRGGGSFDDDSRYRRRADVHFTELTDGGIALLDTQRSLFHGSNEIGRRIWEILESPAAAAQIIDILLEEYDVDADECRRDVRRFLAQLSDNGLIERCE